MYYSTSITVTLKFMQFLQHEFLRYSIYIRAQIGIPSKFQVICQVVYEIFQPHTGRPLKQKQTFLNSGAHRKSRLYWSRMHHISNDYNTFSTVWVQYLKMWKTDSIYPEKLYRIWYKFKLSKIFSAKFTSKKKNIISKTFELARFVVVINF